MAQKKLDELEWEPEPDPEGVEEWVKLDVGDILYGIYAGHYEDKTYGKNNYIFTEVMLKRKGSKGKEQYTKVGLNGSKNLERKMANKEENVPLKIERMEDIEVDKPNPMKCYQISVLKKHG